jgi:hypothetical protein
MCSFLAYTCGHRSPKVPCYRLGHPDHHILFFGEKDTLKVPFQCYDCAHARFCKQDGAVNGTNDDPRKHKEGKGRNVLRYHEEAYACALRLGVPLAISEHEDSVWDFGLENSTYEIARYGRKKKATKPRKLPQDIRRMGDYADPEVKEDPSTNEGASDVTDNQKTNELARMGTLQVSKFRQWWKGLF